MPIVHDPKTGQFAATSSGGSAKSVRASRVNMKAKGTNEEYKPGSGHHSAHLENSVPKTAASGAPPKWGGRKTAALFTEGAAVDRLRQVRPLVRESHGTVPETHLQMQNGRAVGSLIYAGPSAGYLQN